jgi:Uma2 family endonuclease
MWPPEYLITEEEYLVREPEAEYKSEYRQGRVVAMAGVSMAHAQIESNLGGQLYVKLRGGPCRSFLSSAQIKIAAARVYTYPDAVVVCGEPIHASPAIVALENPAVIFEVLSRSTQKYDRGEKFGYYRQLDSLQAYVLIDQYRMRVERFTRSAEGDWPVQVWSDPADLLTLRSIGAELRLADLYENVVWAR